MNEIILHTQHRKSVTTMSISFFASANSFVAEVELSPIFSAEDFTDMKMATYLKLKKRGLLLVFKIFSSACTLYIAFNIEMTYYSK